MFHAKARRREGWRASVPTSRLPLRGGMVSGSLAEYWEGRASLVRGQADACPSQRFASPTQVLEDGIWVARKNGKFVVFVAFV